MMYRLPDALRPVLAEPFGPVHDTGEAIRKVQGRLVIAVGDVVTQTFLDHGVVPKLMVIDGVTQRGSVVQNALAGLPTHGVKRVTVQNPPAALTQQLIAAMDTALKGKGSTVITVKGEEDLAALPAMIMAPEGAAVCYGQPPRGVVFREGPGAPAGAGGPGGPLKTSRPGLDRGGVVIVIVTPEVRRRATDILHQMEVK